MNCTLPYWIQVLQALLTPAIAFLAVVIGVFQWRTGQQRVVLDLFDRRLVKYVAVRDIVRQVKSSGGVPPNTGFQFGATLNVQFHAALDGLEFIFAKDIIEPLNAIDEALWQLSLLGPELKEAQQNMKGAEPEVKAQRTEHRGHMDTVEKSYTTFLTRLQPYMRMHEKATWWPWG